MPARHPHDTEGQRDGDHDGETLGYGGHGEADAHVEHLEDGLALDAADRHDEADDGQGVDRQLLAQGVHALLQGGPEI